jgi:hypothetical protein
MMEEEIKTSDEKWFEKAVKAYSKKQPFSINDDQQLGLKETDVKSAVSLISFARKQHIVPWKKITQVLASIGITGFGLLRQPLPIRNPPAN